MQFNSFVFILLLLPVSLILYFLANKINSTSGKIILIISSLIFYCNFEIKTLTVLLLSVAINYLFSMIIRKTNKFNSLFTFLPILINITILLYYKYYNFGISNINRFFETDWALKELMIPLGISFFTFQQIAYLTATKRHELSTNSLIDYLAYILYFPKILMGPLMDPVDFINQINDTSKKKLSADNIAYGLKIFSFGLFKKVMLADVFAAAVNWGFSDISILSSMDLILIMLFYTFEIYFDFSGYSDMAVGASIMFNIELPINFDSPYKALSIRDFWKRWHISLTKFFTKNIYFPLGGSRKGKIRTYLNVLIVFLVSGIWHGANWTFILWGVLHGALMIFDRIFEKYESKVFEPARWLLTFSITNVLWLLFRSNSISQWLEILKSILSLQSTSVSPNLINYFVLSEASFIAESLNVTRIVGAVNGFWMVIYIIVAFIVCLIPQNNYTNLKKLSIPSMFTAALLFIWGFICLSHESTFVYFNF